MKSTLRGLLVATAALCALASTAYAQTVTPLSIKDGTGATQTLCEVKPDGTNFAACALTYGFDGTNYHALLTDTLGRLIIAPLSSGSAHAGSFNLLDSGLGDISDPVGHANYVEPAIAGRFNTGPVSISTLTSTTLAAGTSGNWTYITDLDCANTGTVAYSVAVANATPTNIYSMQVPAGQTVTKSFVTPIGGPGQMPATFTPLSVTAAYNGAALTQSITSGTYNTGTGAVVLMLPVAIPVYVGEPITISGLTGTGAFASLEPGGLTVTAISSNQLTYTVTGQAASTITGGTVTYQPAPAGLSCVAQGHYRNQ